MPSLQGFGSKFGVRQCEGIVKVGLVWFDIDETGKKPMDWGYSVMNMETKQKGRILEPRLK